MEGIPYLPTAQHHPQRVGGDYLLNVLVTVLYQWLVRVGVGSWQNGGAMLQLVGNSATLLRTMIVCCTTAASTQTDLLS